MATRSLMNSLANRSVLLSRMDCLNANRNSVKPVSGLSSNKSFKHSDNQKKLWTNKEHEEWVDRKFGHLKQLNGKEVEKPTKKSCDQ